MKDRKKYFSLRTHINRIGHISYRQGILLICLLAILWGMVILSLASEKSFSIQKNPVVVSKKKAEIIPQEKPQGVFTGVECPEAVSRPLAVMLAGDPEARPLSGLQDADLVIEMPVIVGSITRYMAFFQCHHPLEIGSIRSARAPFIGLARGYNAVFAHWGGERDALDSLRSGVINNLDALVNPFGAYWRKRGIPMPHNGFSSYGQLLDAATRLNYPMQIEPVGFFTFKKGRVTPCSLCHHSSFAIGYPGPFRVEYMYHPEKNVYTRTRGGTAEIEALTHQPVEVTNVIAMWTRIYPLYSQYSGVDLEGAQGAFEAFTGGNHVTGTWRKEGFDKPLIFTDSAGKPLELLPGNTWIQILGLDQSLQVTPPTPVPPLSITNP